MCARTRRAEQFQSSAVNVVNGSQKLGCFAKPHRQMRLRLAGSQQHNASKPSKPSEAKWASQTLRARASILVDTFTPLRRAQAAAEKLTTEGPRFQLSV